MRLGLGLGLGIQGTVPGGDHELPLVKYLFIDGGCLRATTEKMLEALPLEDRSDLSIGLSRLAAGFDKAFYYDAISAQDHGEAVTEYQARVEIEYERFDEIRALDGFHVSLGEIKGKGGKRRQKRVDVQLAVDMLTHSFRNNMQSATLFAGDDDFIPLIEALVREGMKITIWHPPQASKELLSAADNRILFNLSNAHSFLTRDGVNPAFYIGSGGGGQPTSTANSLSWSADGINYLAEFTGGNLTVWSHRDGFWQFKALRCAGASLKAAAIVFSAATGWPVYLPADQSP